MRTYLVYRSLRSGLCYIFAFVFAYAALSKLLDYETFHTQLIQSPIIGIYADLLWWLVPSLEVVIAILLVYPKYRLLGLYGFMVMMLQFTVYIVLILFYSPFTPCSCGGILEELNWEEHLYFNLLFVVLSFILLLKNSSFRKFGKRFLFLFVVVLFSIGTVLILYYFSKETLSNKGVFARQFIPHTLNLKGKIPLASNSFYISGYYQDTLYLGNYHAPLHLTQVSSDLMVHPSKKITIDSLHLPYERVRIIVNDGDFYLGDGVIPIMFKGKTDDLKGSLYTYRLAYFDAFFPISKERIAISTKSAVTRGKAFGIINLAIHPPTLSLTPLAPTDSTFKGTFAQDGHLLWNSSLREFIYVYYYKNTYLRYTPDFVLTSEVTTLDTVHTPIIDVSYSTKKKTYELSSHKTLMVHRHSSTHGDYLFIHSNRLGLNESYEAGVSIVDIYSISKSTYLFSIRLFHEPSASLNLLEVYENKLFMMVGNQLYWYELSPLYYKID